MPSHPDLLVVGAGPVGLFAAVCARASGLSVRVVDEQRRVPDRSYALALHPATVRLFAQHGLASAVLARGRRLDRIVFYEGPDRRLEVRLDALATTFPFLVVLPQHELEELLLGALRARGVQVEWERRVVALEQDAEGIRCDLQQVDRSAGSEKASDAGGVRSRWLIGADGQHSAVRRLMGIGQDAVGVADDYAVFEFDGSGFTDEVRVVLGERTTDVLWPLTDGRWRWSIQVTNGREVPVIVPGREFRDLGAHTFEQLGAQLLRDLLVQRAPWFGGRIGAIHWSVRVRFARGLVSRPGEGRAWLAGDAAHLAGPVGVHSMNGGLQEVAGLAEAMAAGQPDAAAAWAHEQHAGWRRLLGLDPTSPPDPRRAGEWAAARRDRIRDALPATGRELQQLMLQLGLATPTA